MPYSSPIALATSVYFSWILVVHLFQCQGQFRFVKKGLNVSPGKVFSLIPVPRLNPWAFVIANLVFSISLVMILLEPGSKLFMGTALLSYFLYFGQVLKMANVRRKTNMIPLVLLILLLAPVSTDIQSETYRLTVFLLQLSVVQMYVSSGLQKLRGSGVRWADGKTLQTIFVQYAAWSDNKLALSIGRRPLFCKVLSFATLLFECTFWIILVFPELTIPYVIAGFLFHFGTSLALKIHYIYYFIPVYAWLLIGYLG